MMLIERIQNVFPQVTDIPETLLNDIPCIQTGYLVDGEIRIWDGPRQEVLSPVWAAGDEDLKPFFIGEYPLLTETETKKGGFNPGGYSNKKIDELSDKIEQETDKAKRDAMLKEAQKIHLDEVGHIPLHQQAVVWAMRKNVDVVQRADNVFP